MPRPHEYPDDLRDRLVDAAAHLLATEGPAGLSTRRIAGQLGVSTTAIYRLWGSKPQLVRALFVEGFRRLAVHLAEVEATDDPAGRPPGARASPITATRSRTPSCTA